MAINRPYNLNDSVWDFGTSGSIPASFYVSMYLSSDTNYSNSYSYNCSYLILKEAGGVVNNFTDQLGNRTRSIPNITDNGSGFFTIKRTVNAPGLCEDIFTINGGVTAFGASLGTSGVSFGTTTVVTPMDQTDDYQYAVFQQAVAVISNVVGGTSNLISQGSILTASVGDTLNFNVSDSRGSNLSRSMSILYRNTSNIYVSALENVDYQIVSGTVSPSTSDYVQIKFLKSTQYKLSLNVEGYNSSNNPYGVSTADSARGLITSNVSSVTFEVHTAVDSITSTITFPKIVTSVSPSYVLTSSPLSSFEYSNITITGTPDATTGIWSQFDGTTTTMLTLSSYQWASEILLRCNVSCLISDATTGAPAYNTLNGFGPHNIVLPKGNYSIVFQISKT